MLQKQCRRYRACKSAVRGIVEVSDVGFQHVLVTGMEREPPQGFDVLAVDAFSSDSIPVHLITREALAVYLRHMKPGGVIAFHVSNRFLNLPPVVGRLAKEQGLAVTLVSDEGKEGDDDHTKTDWVLLSRDPKALEAKEIAAAAPQPPDEKAGWRTWTDDYSNLVQILK